MSSKKHFTVNLKIDYYHSPEEDKLLERNPKELTAGSFWQWSVSDVLDADNRVLNTQSVIQIEMACKHGGLPLLLKDIVTRLPRFLDENGLTNR